MKKLSVKQAISVSGLIALLIAGYLYIDSQNSADLCQSNQLKVSQIDIGTKDKDRLALHMDYSFASKVKRYLPHVSNAKSKVYYQKRQKHKPSLISLTTEYKSKKKAKSAFRYLKRKWSKKKKGQHDVILKDKTVTWFSNSHYTPQCFYQMVETTKKEMGITDKTGKTNKQTQVASKKKIKKKKTLSKVASKKKMKRKKKLASIKKSKKAKKSKKSRKRSVASARK